MSLTLARPIRTAISLQPWGARTALLVVVAAAFVAGFAITDAPTAHRAVSFAGPDLTRVLRGMALPPGASRLATLGAARRAALRT